MKSAEKEEFGDFQTPLPLAEAVCRLIAARAGVPEVILEPTCGAGAFLRAAAAAFPNARLQGLDINAEHLAVARKAMEFASGRTVLTCRDFFQCDWEEELRRLEGRLLILGNPPWVTNSAVSALNGTNLPQKENFMGLKGLAARTGKANFDISEWMLIRLLQALEKRPAVLAMLCKTGTARKFLRYAWQNAGRIAKAEMFGIDAKEHFGAAVDACLLLVETGTPGVPEAGWYDALESAAPSRRIGLAGKDLVADIRAWRELHHLEGLSAYQWRSGIKHDCAAVMEWRRTPAGELENGLGEIAGFEQEYVFPLLKCTDLAHGRFIPSRSILVTQRYVGDDTAVIATRAPGTWAYLQRHRDRFAARKSSIYRGKVPFTLFGIGDYSFAPWKVAVSGLHRQPRFLVIPPCEGRPVMLDDTCYFLPFATEKEARLVCRVLHSSPCQRFLAALVFPDAKRAVTVELLQRLNLRAIALEAGLGTEWDRMQHAKFGSEKAPAQLELVMEEPGPYRAPHRKKRAI